MSPISGNDHSQHSLVQMDQICAAFEQAWRTGQIPRIEDFLQQEPAVQQQLLLQELVAIEVDYRRRRFEKPKPEEYQSRFPSLDSSWLVDVLTTTLERSSISSSSKRTKLNEEDSHWTDPCPTSASEPFDSFSASIKSSFPDYQVLNQLGRGGMGVVYRARHLPTRRMVALKMIRPDRLEGLPSHERFAWLSRFRKEAQSAARSTHPNVVTVYEVGEAGGVPYYSMQYIDGRSLSDILREGPLPNRLAAQWLEQVARAVHHVHGCEILHRDLKPSNILIDRDSQPHVTDFGLAKWHCGSAASILTNGPIGTPSYMAPEQAQSSSDNTAASDTYALGATLYAMLTGQPPFRAADPVETLRQVIHEDPVPPRQQNPAIDRDLELICLKCLAKEPKRRYQSAEQLAEELHRYLVREPLGHTRPVSRVERLRLWCRRNPALALARGIAVAAVLGLITAVAAFHIYQANVTKESMLATERAAWSALDKGYHWCEQGYVSEGMLWLGHSLRLSHTMGREYQADTGGLKQVVRQQLDSWQWAVCPLQGILEFDQNIQSADLGPDGQRILVGDATGKVRLWGITTGEPIGKPMQHQDPVNVVAISPDGKLALSGCGASGNIEKSEAPEACLWNLDTGELIYRFTHKHAVLTAGYSHDGKYVFTGGWDRCVHIWTVTDGKQVGQPFRHPGPVVAADLSPDGKYLITAFEVKSMRTGRQKTRLWEVATGKLLCESPHVRMCTLSLRFTLAGAALWATVEGKDVQLWELSADGSERSLSVLEQAAIPRTASFSADKRRILIGSDDRRARLWEVSTGQAVAAQVVNEDPVTFVTFSRDGTHFLTGCDSGTTRRWRTPPERSVSLPLMPQHPYPLEVACSPTGDIIVTVSHDGRRDTHSVIECWSTSTGQPLIKFKRSGYVRKVVFDPLGESILIGEVQPDRANGRGCAQVQSLTSPAAVGPPLVHAELVTAAAWSPNGRYLVTGTAEGAVRLWEVKTGECIRWLPSRHGRVHDLAFSPDGRWIASANLQRTAGLWDWRADAVFSLPHVDPVHAVAFSPDGSKLLTGSGDTSILRGEARQWDVTKRISLHQPLRHNAAVHSVAYSSHGRMLVTGSADGTAQVWNAITGRRLGLPLLHGQPVDLVAFSSGGVKVISASKNGCAKIWPNPRPRSVELDKIQLWLEVVSGMALELTTEGIVQTCVLPPKDWRQRRQRFERLYEGMRP